MTPDELKAAADLQYHVNVAGAIIWPDGDGIRVTGAEHLSPHLKRQIVAQRHALRHYLLHGRPITAEEEDDHRLPQRSA